MEKSRTQNTIKNVKTSLIVQIINKLIRFVVRTVFIKNLSTEYLGINGLFQNILMILSFAELGIGTAIIFNMYKPIADENHEKLKSLMQLYKKSYSIVGIVIFVLGICIIPFIDLIIKEKPNIKEEISLIYILFLLNTSISYFWAYKKSIIIAYQQENITRSINGYCQLARSILEITFLILTKEYIVYLIIQIIITILENISIAHKANRMFPFLKQKTTTPLSKNEIKEIFLNVKSLIVYKFGTAMMDGSDNILISSLVGINTLGLCSNYTLMFITLKEVLVSLLNESVIASVGNLNVTGKTDKKEKVFYELTFISFWIYDICAIAFIILLNPFIKIWLGNEYLLTLGVPITLAISFFICGMRTPCYTYRLASGLFNKSQFIPYIGLITNIIFSVILCKKFGVVGIFIATSISQLLSYSWIEPYLIHKYEFNTSVNKYFKKYLRYILAFSVEVLICIMLINLIKFEGILNFTFRMLIAIIVPNIINLIFFYNKEEYKDIKEKLVIPIIRKYITHTNN